MSFLIQYLFKLFICLAVVYLFYKLVLRKLTFYNWNRWYLLGYSLICFLIPFINITPVLQSNQLTGNDMVQIIPAVEVYTGNIETISDCPAPVWSSTWSKWDWALLVLCIGALLLLARLAIRYYSFYRLKRGAELIGNDGMKLYQVNKPIMPFSFGDSIFINRHLHDENELQEIIRHEFVHVRQKHSHDIIWSEILCILNWYNPFAWMIRKAIRQNLEFIADNKVLENGFDRKQYQYLLLKVVGNNHFRIANQFNFSSLKKRIAMMNQMKSARTHLFKFLFILPLLAVLLLAFRNEVNRPASKPIVIPPPQQLADTPLLLNEKGYNVEIIGVQSNCTVVVKDKNGKEVERLLLTKWNEKESYYEGLYGMILPPAPPRPPAAPAPAKMHRTVSSIRVSNNQATVTLKNGTTEFYDLDNEKEKAEYIKKYGELPPPPPPPPAKPPVREVSVQSLNEVNVAVATNINSPVTTTLSANVITPAKVNNLYTGVNVASTANTVVGVNSNAANIINTPVSVNTNPGTTFNAAPATFNAAPIVSTHGVSVAADSHPLKEVVVTGKPSDHETILEFRIYKNTTREKLNEFIEQAKAKDVELSFEGLKYNSSNQLTSISGKMKKGGSKSEFTINGSDEISIILRVLKVKNKNKFILSVINNTHKEEV
jgi:beta-lactamase regulating signal transducer with metallopeptidase domain